MPVKYNVTYVTGIQMYYVPLQWRQNGRDGVSTHQPHDCLLNRLFRRRSKKTSKLRVTGLCVGSSPVAGEFPAQMASNAENVSIWWRHHASSTCYDYMDSNLSLNPCTIKSVTERKISPHVWRNWKPRVVVTTTFATTSEDQVGNMTTLSVIIVWYCAESL